MTPNHSAMFNHLRACCEVARELLRNLPTDPAPAELLATDRLAFSLWYGKYTVAARLACHAAELGLKLLVSLSGKEYLKGGRDGHSLLKHWEKLEIEDRDVVQSIWPQRFHDEKVAAAVELYGAPLFVGDLWWSHPSIMETLEKSEGKYLLFGFDLFDKVDPASVSLEFDLPNLIDFAECCRLAAHIRFTAMGYSGSGEGDGAPLVTLRIGSIKGADAPSPPEITAAIDESVMDEGHAGFRLDWLG